MWKAGRYRTKQRRRPGEQKQPYALAQLSVSRRACKDESARLSATVRGAELFDLDAKQSRRQRKSCIETRRRRITITRGGPHRKTQRVERSVRSRSPFCRHT